MLKFMKSGLRQILAIVPAILFSIIMPAQELPVMPADPSIISGVLPNGMSYFVASDPSDRGIAEFALVQKTGLKNIQDDPDRVVAASRDALVRLPRLDTIPPHRFFSRHGSSPGTEGYVSVKDDATVFRFRDVHLSDGKTVLDSAILVMMDLADRVSFTEDAFLRKWYSPADQAVVVAGDVDAKAVVSRLEAMSYMTPAVPSAGRTDPLPEAVADITVADKGSLTTVSLRWVSGRVPREYMNTVQPVIFDMSVDVLGKLAVRRIRYALKERDIPFVQVSYRHSGTDTNPYDDVFTVTATVETGQAETVSGIMTGVMRSIDADGVAVDEYLWAENTFFSGLKHKADSPLSDNSDLVDRCISAYLYNSSLASARQLYAFHKSRDLPDTMRCRLFNDVAAALLYPLAYPADTSFVLPLTDVKADTSAFPGYGPKVRIKSSRKDHISGGTIWTFSNGFKVVYRNMPSAGDVHYTLALNGGYAGISDLGEGEGAFISDIFRLSDIAGMSGDGFKALLQRYGIQMDMRVTMSNTLIEGNLPKERMSLLMKSLLALANDRRLAEDGYAYYRRCENLSLSFSQDHYASRRTAIDSIMCPGFRYSPFRSEGRLTDSFCTKADRFLSGQMQKMNDGVLVIVGDISEEQLKKTLLEYVGGFRTSDAAVRRPVMRYQPVSGWSTYTVDGEMNAVDLALSARMPLTAVNCLAADIAVMLLERNLAEALADTGMSFDIAYECRIYPEERLNVMVSLVEADEDGFASGMMPAGSIEVLAAVRRVLSDIVSGDMEDAEFKNMKAYLKNSISLQMKDPAYWVNAVTVRHLDGKDITTGYAANIDALTKEDVRRIFTFLEKGCKVEYVTTH